MTRVTHVGGIRQAVDLGHLEVHVPVEPLEQPLTRTEDHRRRRDDQLVDPARRQRLPDDAGAATDGDITVASRLSRLGERRVKAGDEPEPGLRRRLVRDAVGEHEQSSGERVGPTHAPAASYMPRPTTPEAIVETSSS